jgi:tetratricopeptide (TPR) repeat protein
MTEVVCKKCGQSLPLEGGLPPVWKVIKCPSCNHPNIIQGTQQGGGPVPGKAAAPSIPVTLGPPGPKPSVPAPPAKRQEPALDVDLGESGNETVQDDPAQREFDHALQATRQYDLSLGKSGDEGFAAPRLASSPGDVDLGESGNTTAHDEIPAAPAYGRAPDVDLGAPGDGIQQQRQRKLARDTAATVELGPPGDGPLDDVLSASLVEDDGQEGAAHGIEIVELGEDAHENVGLALAEEAELPAPVMHAEPEFLHLPPPQESRPAPRARGAMGAELPAPVRGGRQSGVDLPAPAQRSASVSDLPAPARKQAGVADLPAPAQRSASVSDLPAPARKQAGVADLPAPAQRSASVSDLPAPARKQTGVADLPAPAQRSASVSDLPAPARRQAGDPELPVPAARSSQASAASRADLPQPVKPGRPGASADLPQPVKPGRPGASTDLPAPKGFFDDLPEPAEAARPGASTDLPVPKGFFDDLLEPAETARPAASPDLPAPKGFELGGPGNALDGGRPNAFDDLEIGQGNITEAGGDLFGGAGMDFNPLGGPAIDAGLGPDLGPGLGPDLGPGERTASMGLGAEDDPFGFSGPSSLALADPDEVQPLPDDQQPFALNGLELEASHGEDGLSMEPLALDRSSPVAQPPAAAAKAPRAVESARPAAPAAASDFDSIGLGSADDDDFGLPSPSVPGMPPIAEPPRNKAPAAKAPARPAAKAPARATARPAPRDEAGDAAGGAGGEEFGGLELPAIEIAGDEPPKKPAAKPKADAKAEKPAARPRGRALGKKEEEETPIGIEESAVPRVVQGHLAGSTLTERHLARRRQRRKRIIVAAASVAVLVLAGGGFIAYQRWDAERSRKANIRAAVDTAVAHLREGDPGHWDQAFQAANGVLALAPDHPDGLGIAAQAAYAALLDEGLRVEEWRKHGTELTGRMDKAALVQGEHVEKAQALKSLDQQRAVRAIELLQNVLLKAPNDPDALLYRGWAYAAAYDHKNAASDFQRAIETAPARPVPALYGLGRAQLAQGDRKAARATFEKVLAARANHFGALVGVVEATEDLKPEEREARYLEIVNRQDASQADPRAVSWAWTLAGRLSLEVGRAETARPRFENALKIYAANPQALVGLARAALLQDRLDNAQEALTAVLGTDPKSMDVLHQADAVLARAELSLRQGKPEDATTYLDLIFASEQHIEDVRAVANAYVLRGTMLGSDEAKREDAIKAYKRALELAGADALEPALKLAELYTTLGRMEEARTVLGPVESRATSDAAAAVALGTGYKRANAWNDAETWLRKALELRPGDIDAQFQLGQVLAAKKQYDEAIQVLTEASKAAPDRPEVALRLAVVFEEIGRLDEAAAAYERLLQGDAPSVELMARAGRFYVRQGKAERAGELGERILAVKDSEAAGHFLRGEAKYRGGDYAEARASFRRAAGLEPDAEYLEANGRASERLAELSTAEAGVDLYDEAFEAYSEAVRKNPNFLAPQLGRIRLLLIRRDFARALEELTKLRETAPRNAAVYHYLGESYRLQEEHDKAASYYRTALEYDDNRADTHYGLGKTYLELSKDRDAARAFDRATTLARRQAGRPAKWLEDAYYELGYVQRAQSKRREAIQAWKAYLELIPAERAKEREVVEVKRLLMSLEAQTR